ncbi:MAG TPA: hypothetical protein VGA92_06715 [Candidatus Nitrosotenuis sp.]
MSSMKCISCGKSFFSPMGYNKCNICAKKDGDSMGHDEHEGHGHEGHDSCGCGHSH